MRLGATAWVLLSCLLFSSSAYGLTAPPIEPPRTFSGHGTNADEALGTITVGNESVLTWSCPGCTSSNFILHDEEYELSVNALDETSGQIALKPGTYKNVTIFVDGSFNTTTFQEESPEWSFTITPIEKRQPVTEIHVVTKSHHGRTFQHPGYTTLEVKTAPEAAAFMTVDFWYGKRHLGQRWWRPPYTPQELAEARTFDFPWSCGPHGGGTIRYEAHARGESGETLHFDGSFRENLSARWCRSAKRRLEAAERRRGEEESRVRREERQAEEQRNRERASHERAELERYESNCRTLGGTPVTIKVGNGTARVCRGPNGGIIPVPT